MALTKFEKDMAIIQKLDDEPNDVGGLTSAELKAKFDEGGEAIKKYINDTLVPNVVPNSTTVNGHPLSDNLTVTKEDVGLGNVDNTSDEDKPVSIAQKEALDAKADKTNVLQKDNATPYTPTQPYHPATKDYTDKAVAGAVMGQVPDGSITDKKLANDSVTEEKLSSSIRESVTENFPNHIANKENPHGVTPEKINAVPTERRINGKPLSSDINLSADNIGADKKWTTISSKSLTFYRTNVGTEYNSYDFTIPKDLYTELKFEMEVKPNVRCSSSSSGASNIYINGIGLSGSIKIQVYNDNVVRNTPVKIIGISKEYRETLSNDSKFVQQLAFDVGLLTLTLNRGSGSADWSLSLRVEFKLENNNLDTNNTEVKISLYGR